VSALNKDTRSEISSSSQDYVEDRDKPIKFSTSNANKHRAYDTFCTKSNAPWYQIYIVTFSAFVFLLYFGVLREENDMDEYLSLSVGQRVPAVQEQTLVQQIRDGKQLGKDVSELVNEVKELRKQYKLDEK